MLGCRSVLRRLKAALAAWVCSSAPGFTSYTKMETGLPVAWGGHRGLRVRAGPGRADHSAPRRPQSGPTGAPAGSLPRSVLRHRAGPK